MPTDKITKTFRFDKKFTVHFPPRQEWLEGVLPPSRGATWYTDGSLINKSAGAGIFCANPSVEQSISLGKYSSIFLAEIRAILEGVRLNRRLNNSNFTQNIFICSDSQAALKALSSVKFTSALTLQTWDALNSLATSHKVALIWVPSHSNIVGNEKADTLAKIGANTNPIGPEPILKIPHSIKQQKIMKLRETKFVKHWNNISTCRQAKNCIRINNKYSKYLINLSRTRLKIFTGVMTGHFYFNKHLTTIGRYSHTGCDYCGHHTDTAEHFLCNCPAFITKRRRFLGNYTIKYSLIKNLHPQDMSAF